MNIKIGIVGLPNVGKSTLFNALTKSSKAQAENFPFCTIDPNTGIVAVPDERLQKLAKIVNPQKIQSSTMEFVDIAGLVKGASQGEGLGNQFLSHIRECNSICHVLRDFPDSEIHHVSGVIDPESDFEIIKTELILADLESVIRQIEKIGKKIKTGDKNVKIELAILEKVREILEKGDLANKVLEELNEEEVFIFDQFHLLTAKKFMIVANVSEIDFANFDEKKFREKTGILEKNIPIIPICAKIEADLIDMSEEDVCEFLKEMGTEKSGLENLAKAGFELLDLQSYFTAGEQEVRAWTIKKGSTAPQSAGEIHTDFEKGFIKADVISCADFIANNGEQGAKEAGKLRLEGKDYIVQDGDVMHFKFNN